MRRPLFVFLFLTWVMSGGCLSKEENTFKSEEPKGVRLTSQQLQSNLLSFLEVHSDTLKVELEALGVIASDTDRVSQIRSDVPGRLEKILVGVGQPIQKGQLIANYRTEDHPSHSQKITASSRGVILGVYAEPGDTLDPLIPLATVADVSRLRCIFDIFEKDIGRIREGQKVRVKVSAYPEDIFWGSVTYISPRVNESSRTIKVRVDVENPEGKLKFGMSAVASISLSERQVLMVPESAIQNIDGRDAVIALIRDDSLMVRYVDIGSRVDGRVEIKSGLQEGERIIGEGGLILKDLLVKEATRGSHG